MVPFARCKRSPGLHPRDTAASKMMQNMACANRQSHGPWCVSLPVLLTNQAGHLQPAQCHRQHRHGLGRHHQAAAHNWIVANVEQSLK